MWAGAVIGSGECPVIIWGEMPFVKSRYGL